MTLILMIAACVCIFMQAFQWNVKNVEIGWLGLFFWALAITLPMILGAVHLSNTALLIIVVIVVLIVILFMLRRRGSI